ncbi:MAG TPA: cystathionine beta-synthase [Chloroflexota bacterium]|nr:cystathionine beta-synthase [Chloroflexota bacterium]
MHVYDSVLDAVGRSPLIRLRRIGRGVRPTILGKAEHLQPGGSIKDRIGVSMIETAEQAGLLKPGGTIVEPTAGNTGTGLAQAACIKGYKCIFVMPDKVSQEKIALLKAYGAEVVLTPTAVPHESPESYYAVADRLTREIPGACQPNQFANPANPETHYRTTGPEIWAQTAGQVDVFVAGLGTGGTISGAGRYLKEQKPALMVVGVDPEGSVYSGDTLKPYKVEGIGQSFIPETADLAVIDRWVRVGDRDSFLTARRLAREEGLLVGGSSGTAVYGALQVAQDLDESKTIVVILSDTGRNYLSKIFSDDWMRQNGFLERFPARRVADAVMVRKRGELPPLVYALPRQKVGEAIDTMQRYGISQMPIFEETQPLTLAAMIGSIEERDLLDRIYRDPEKIEADVSTAMGLPFPIVEDSSDVETAFEQLLNGANALVVAHNEVPVGLITRLDLLEFAAHRTR